MNSYKRYANCKNDNATDRMAAAPARASMPFVRIGAIVLRVKLLRMYTRM